MFSKLTASRLIIGAAVLTLANLSAIANNPIKPASKKFRPNYRITGNPMGVRNNYTINAAHSRYANMECIFINSADQSKKLNIWTQPSRLQPQLQVSLKQGNKGKPYQLIKNFSVKLKKHWWCRVYLNRENINKWGYCAYFAISAKNTVDYNPFSNNQATPIASDTTFHCRLKKPNRNISFFDPVRKEPTKKLLSVLFNK